MLRVKEPEDIGTQEMGFQAGAHPAFPPFLGHNLLPLACAATRVGRAGWHSVSSVLPGIAVHIKKSFRKMTPAFCSGPGIRLLQGFSTQSPLQDTLDATEKRAAPRTRTTWGRELRNL